MPLPDASYRPNILRKLRSAISGVSVDAPASADIAKDENEAESDRNGVVGDDDLLSAKRNSKEVRAN